MHTNVEMGKQVHCFSLWANCFFLLLFFLFFSFCLPVSLCVHLIHTTIGFIPISKGFKILTFFICVMQCCQQTEGLTSAQKTSHKRNSNDLNHLWSLSPGGQVSTKYINSTIIQYIYNVQPALEITSGKTTFIKLEVNRCLVYHLVSRKSHLVNQCKINSTFNRKTSCGPCSFNLLQAREKFSLQSLVPLKHGLRRGMHFHEGDPSTG